MLNQTIYCSGFLWPFLYSLCSGKIWYNEHWSLALYFCNLLDSGFVLNDIILWSSDFSLSGPIKNAGRIVSCVASRTSRSTGVTSVDLQMCFGSEKQPCWVLAWIWAALMGGISYPIQYSLIKNSGEKRQPQFPCPFHILRLKSSTMNGNFS